MAKDWTQIYKKYKGLWIALTEDEEKVVSSAKTAKEAWLKAQEKGIRKPILTRVPLEVVPYVGNLQ
jgi:Family of unknown function (DUF5678)